MRAHADESFQLPARRSDIWRHVVSAPGLIQRCRELRTGAVAARRHRANAGVDSWTRGRDRSPAGGEGK